MNKTTNAALKAATKTNQSDYTRNNSESKAHNKFSSMPKLMTQIPNWILWKLDESNKKVPLSTQYYPIDATKSKNGKSFNAVIQTYNPDKCNGLGFIVSDNIVCIDLDHCITDGQLNPLAESLVTELNTYTEISQSGTGLHLFFIDSEAGYVNKRMAGMEIYSGNHYIAMTGNKWKDTPDDLKTLTGKTTELLHRYSESQTILESKSPIESNIPENTEDTEVIAKLKNDIKFQRLFYEGNTVGYPSQSEADAALLVKFAQYTQNTEQLRRLFSQSALNRDKWNSRYYQDYQIANAIKLVKSLTEEKYTALAILQEFYETLDLTTAVYEAAAICKNDSLLKSYYESLRKYCKHHKKELEVKLSEFDEQIIESEKIMLQNRLNKVNKLETPDGVDYIIPEGYQVNSNGIYGMTKNGYKRICKSAIYITHILTDYKTQNIKVNLSIFTKGLGWKNLELVENTTLNNSRIIPLTLGAKITSINSNNAPQLVNYFDDFMECNYKNIKHLKSTTKLGWNNDVFVTPYNDSGYVLDTTNPVAESLTLRGTFEDWLMVAQPIFNYSSVSRFLLSVCFAPIFLEPLKLRSFSVYLWCKTRSGKSSISNLGASIWGTANLIATFGGTLNGFIGGAIERIGFPYIIDDKQQMRENLNINRLIMTLNNEQSDMKMNKDSTLKAVSRWKTIGLFNGEEPIIENFATDGVHTRTLSLHLDEPILTQPLAQTIWDNVVDQNCGWAGKILVDSLKDVNWEELKSMRQSILNALKHQYPEHHEEHLSYVALIMITEKLVSQYIFNEHSKADEMGAEIIEMLETKAVLDNAETEWEHLISWLAKENTHFKRPDTPVYGDCYGEYKKDCLVINKSCLEEEFKRWGNCNIKKLLADLFQKKLILPYYDKAQKTPRKLWNTTINGVHNVPSIKIDLKLLDKI